MERGVDFLGCDQGIANYKITGQHTGTLSGHTCLAGKCKG
jgi:hypothetical protein